MWSGFMQKWIDHTAAMIAAERARGAAPETLPAARPGDVAEPDERAHDDGDARPPRQPAVIEDRVVDTLAHIWVTSIYGEQV